MEITLTKEQRNVAHAATTKNEGRPVLQTVRIGDGKISACDGYILAEAEINKNPRENVKTLLIQAADILKSKDNKFTGVVVLAEVEDKVTLIGADLLATIPLDATFPRTDPLYPDTDPVFEISLGYNILQKMLKVCGKDSRIDFTFYGSDKPVKFTNNLVYGIAMPVKKC